MKTLKGIVSINKGQHEVPYDKNVAETLLDAITLELKDGEKVSPELQAAIETIDALFPPKFDKDGKQIWYNAVARVVGDCDYGRDLGVKAKVRQAFERTLEDPTKVVVNGIKAMLAAGFDINTAYQLTKTQRDSKGITTSSLEDVAAKLK